VTAPFRTRGQAVPPAHRPYKTRRAVRVLVVAQDLLLMFHDQDPGLPGSGWWVLPGGGIDAGESPREAARRELAEESGYVVEDADLHGPLATRVVLHGYSDQVTEQAEEFYLVRVTGPYDVDVTGHTAFELESVQGHAWRAVNEESADPVWPLELAALLALAEQPELWPVDLGRVEESPVPLALGHSG
jgi:8-oxo-dGTP pyrophosphatase MutT (NUDIX family)